MHCERCWDTPCVCPDGYGYKHLSLNELNDLKHAIQNLINDKIERMVPPDKREHK